MSFRTLTSAYFQLAGGWRQSLLIAGVYLALAVVAAVASYRAAGPTSPGSVSSTWLVVISVAQGALLLIVAPGAVRRAVLRDFQTGMIESHRLTPLSGLSLVLGYLTGPPAQAALLFGAGILLGSYFASDYGASLGIAGGAVGGWCVSQLFLLPLALMITALVLLIALATAGRANLMVPLVIIGILGGWMVVPTIPGLALLLGVLGGGWFISFLTRGGPATRAASALGWAVLLQAGMAAVFIAAASRKVRAPGRPAFGVRLGLVLLALAALTLLLGIALYADFAWIFDGYDALTWQWLCSSIAFALVALVPLIGAAAERHARDRSASAAGGAVPALRALDLLPALLAAATLLVMGLMLPDTLRPGWDRNRVPLAVALLASFWFDYQCVYWARTRLWGPVRALTIAWLVKLAPLLGEGTLLFATKLVDASAVIDLRLAGLSPLGTMLLIIVPGSVLPGVLAQVILAALATALGRRARRAVAPTRSQPAAPIRPRPTACKKT